MQLQIYVSFLQSVGGEQLLALSTKKKKLINSNLDEAFLKIFIAGQLEGYKSKTKETKRKTHGHVNYKPAIKLTSNSYFLLDNHFL